MGYSFRPEKPRPDVSNHKRWCWEDRADVLGLLWDQVECWHWNCPLESIQPLPLMKTLKFLGVMWFAQGHNKLAAKVEPERILFFHGAQ